MAPEIAVYERFINTVVSINVTTSGHDTVRNIIERFTSDSCEESAVSRAFEKSAENQVRVPEYRSRMKRVPRSDIEPIL